VKVSRHLFLDSEWIYFKIYASSYIQQKLLRYEIFTVVEKLYKKKLLDKFFFVLYQDINGPHLRLRFLTSNESGHREIVTTIAETFSPYLEKGIICKIVAETYNRELERYGEQNIEEIETIFSVNSWYTLCFLKANPVFNEQKWLQSATIIDRQLCELNFNMWERHKFCEHALSLLNKKLGVTQETKKKLQEIFKKYVYRDEFIFENVKSTLTQVSYDRMLISTQTVVSKMNEGAKRDFILNILHMAMNRIFPFSQNVYELIIYDYMNCYYKMKIHNTKTGQLSY